MFEVEVRNVSGEPAAIGNAGPYTVVMDRPADGGGRGVGFNGGQDFTGDPAVSTPIEYDVELSGAAPGDVLRELAARVDEIAEIPNSLRRATPVTLGSVQALEVG